MGPAVEDDNRGEVDVGLITDSEQKGSDAATLPVSAFTFFYFIFF